MFVHLGITLGRDVSEVLVVPGKLLVERPARRRRRQYRYLRFHLGNSAFRVGIWGPGRKVEGLGC